MAWTSLRLLQFLTLILMASHGLVSYAKADDALTPNRLFNQSRERESLVETEAEFETDRDSFTPSARTVQQGRFLVESAWSFIDNRDVPDTHSLPELVLRYGVTEQLELRFGTNYEVGGESNGVSGSAHGHGLEEMTGEIERETAVSYGVKAFLTEQNGLRPESSVIVMGTTPVSGPETASTVVCTYVWGWTFENDWKWDTAIRYGTGRAEEDSFNRWAPSTVVKIPVGEKCDLHAEYFGIMTDGRADELSAHYFSPGIACKVTERLELGVRVGWGLSDDASKFFSNVGIGLQF